jgi:hypothetical protein
LLGVELEKFQGLGVAVRIDPGEEVDHHVRLQETVTLSQPSPGRLPEMHRSGQRRQR